MDDFIVSFQNKYIFRQWSTEDAAFYGFTFDENTDEIVTEELMTWCEETKTWEKVETFESFEFKVERMNRPNHEPTLRVVELDIENFLEQIYRVDVEVKSISDGKRRRYEIVMPIASGITIRQALITIGPSSFFNFLYFISLFFGKYFFCLMCCFRIKSALQCCEPEPCT